MRNRLLAIWLLAPLSALAQRDDDAPLPYDDDEPTTPAKKRPRRDQVREEDDEARATEETLAHLDDPNVGLSIEGLVGAMLFESSKGSLVDPRFMAGVRFTWEYGRLIPDEYLRELFFADVTWQYAATQDGTTQVNSEARFHYLTLAPGFALPLGKSALALFAQVGAGFNATSTTLRIDTESTGQSSNRFLFQYGIGLRGRPAIIASGAVRLSFRLELTRFVRGYMHDTFLGGSVGFTF
jgi:hypothetical protein